MARNGEIDSAALARQIREGPPELALTTDVKKPETGSGFGDWWCFLSQKQTTLINTCALLLACAECWVYRQCNRLKKYLRPLLSG
jgi:hypothetical protein